MNVVSTALYERDDVIHTQLYLWFLLVASEAGVLIEGFQCVPLCRSPEAAVSIQESAVGVCIRVTRIFVIFIPTLMVFSIALLVSIHPRLLTSIYFLRVFFYIGPF